MATTDTRRLSRPAALVALAAVGALVTTSLAFVASGSASARLAVARIVSVDAPAVSSSFTSAPISTSPNDLLVAFVSADGPAAAHAQWVASVSGGGLTWSRVSQSNGQAGAVEIWAAPAPLPLSNAHVVARLGSKGFAGSLTVVAFATAANAIGATATAGAPTGAPHVSLTTTAAGSQVWGAGSDWDNGIARTAALGQSVVHQVADAHVGNTFWVQRVRAASATAGQDVTLADLAPTTDRWDLAAVEIVPTKQYLGVNVARSPFVASGVGALRAPRGSSDNGSGDGPGSGHIASVGSDGEGTSGSGVGSVPSGSVSSASGGGGGSTTTTTRATTTTTRATTTTSGAAGTTTTSGAAGTTTTSGAAGTTTTTRAATTTTTRATTTTTRATTTTTRATTTTTQATTTTPPPTNAPASGGNCTSPIFSSANPQATTNIDGGASYWWVNNDAWSGSAGPQTINVCNQSSWYAVSDQPNNGGQVETYPDTEYDVGGRNGATTKTISQFSSITSTFAENFPAAGGWDAGYDLWTDNWAHETMIWNAWAGGQSFWPSLAAGSGGVQNINLGGVLYNFFANGSELMFFRQSQVASGSVDILAAYQWEVAHGYASASDVPTQLEYGVEISYTSGSETFPVTGLTMNVS